MSEIITNKEKIKLLESAFGKSKLANAGTNISVVCPVCKKSAKTSSNKKKLSIDLDKGIYHCWVCESKGRNIGKFVKYNTNASKKTIIEIYNIFNFSLANEKQEEKIILKLPDDFELLALSKKYSASNAIKYLKNRGLDSDDFLKFKIGISNEEGFYNRVIFPSFDDNFELNFFLSRTTDNTQKIKYRNCDGKKSDVIFNENMIDWSKPVILVEGVFDAIKAGENSIPVLGSWIDLNHAVFRRIIIEDADVVLCFDPDVKEKTLKMAKLFAEFGINVKISQHSNKDFGDMSKEETKYWIENAKHYEQTDRMTYLIQSIRSGSMF